MDDLASALRRLADLHQSGILSDEEFRHGKERLLAGEDTTTPAQPVNPQGVWPATAAVPNASGHPDEVTRPGDATRSGLADRWVGITLVVVILVVLLLVARVVDDRVQSAASGDRPVLIASGAGHLPT
ncbi:hypothetical protein BH23ACT9_BH23ACT9_28220 [soil metagenome]